MPKKLQVKESMRDIISIDETRISLLMVMTTISFGVAMYLLFQKDDIPPNLLQLLFMLIGAISGINIMTKFSQRSGNDQVSGSYSNDGVRLEVEKNGDANSYGYEDYDYENKNRPTI